MHLQKIPNSHPRSSSHTPHLSLSLPFVRTPSPASDSARSTSHEPIPIPTSPQPFKDDLHSARAAPTYGQSAKAFLLGSYVNVLLVAVPLSFVSHFAGWGSTADFVISFLAIIPLAGLLGDATEQLAIKLGQTLGGLMNATFGNAVELIVSILALTKGELRIVQTSLLGSILSNLLLVLGCSFLAAGYNQKESVFQATAAQASSSLMVLATATLILPAAYHANAVDPGSHTLLDPITAADDGLAGLLTLSRGTAIILVLTYTAYLVFQLKTHGYLFADPNGEDDEEESKMNLPAAAIALVTVTVITSFCADYLVGAIDEFANDYSIPKAFIGIILLPIVGNAAEHVTAVTMAAKGKMELVIGVAVGSSIQIAAGVIPVIVLAGWIINQPLTLFFENFETVAVSTLVLRSKRPHVICH